MNDPSSALELRDATVAQPPRYTYDELLDKLPESTRPCELFARSVLLDGFAIKLDDLFAGITGAVS